MNSTDSTCRVPVTLSALVQRVNRVLAKEFKVLRKCRQDSQWLRDVGDWYVTDESRNSIDMVDIDPIQLARELGVLREGELVPSS